MGVNWGAGLLAVGAGMGAGIARSMGDGARARSRDALADKKEKALTLRQENMLRLSHQLSQDSKTSDRAYAKTQKGSGKWKDGAELSNEDFSMLNDEDQGNTISTQANKDSIQANEDERAKGLATFTHNLSKDDPIDLEKKYKFLSGIYGEEKAKALISGALNKTTGKTDMERQKLYQKTYMDAVESFKDLQGNLSPEDDTKAKNLAMSISGFNPGSGGGKPKGGLADLLGGKGGEKDTAKVDPEKVDPAEEKPKVNPKSILANPNGPGQTTPRDPSEWNVQFMGPGEQKPFIMEGRKMRELTEEEYSAYKKATSRGAALKDIIGGFGGKTQI